MDLLVSALKYYTYIVKIQVPQKIEILTFMMQKKKTFSISKFIFIMILHKSILMSCIDMQHLCMIYTSIQNTANSFTDNDFSLDKLGIKLNGSPVALLYKNKNNVSKFHSFYYENGKQNVGHNFLYLLASSTAANCF